MVAGFGAGLALLRFVLVAFSRFLAFLSPLTFKFFLDK